MANVHDTTVEDSRTSKRVFGGRYEIVEELGTGGMASVYLGRDRVLTREVAIKVLHPHLGARADARRRFNREAQAIARLKHAHIVEIYDFSDGDAAEAFLVAEFVDGLTLSDWYARHGPLLPQTAALVGYAIAGALKHAHSAGIVHRDIKPDNLMISRLGELKLMDFGIATILGVEGMTATGAIIGSPAHMAPEQIEGGEINERVDVFAFGTLMYFLTTGQLPFSAPNPHALFRQILEGHFDPPSRYNAAVDKRMEDLIVGCLRRSAADRIGSMTSLLSLLDSYLRSHELTEPERMLKEFLSAPEQFQSTWRPVIVAKLCDEGRRQAAQGSLALAIDAYNQALALDRQCEAAKSGLSSLTSRSRRRRRAKMVGVAALGVAAALALGALVFAPQPPPERREASAVNAPLLMEGPTGLAAVNQPGDVGGGATARASAQVQPSADVSQAVAASSDAVAGGADVRVEIAASGDAGTLQRRAPKTRDKRRRGGGARLTNANRSKRRPTAVGGAKEVEAPRPLPTLPVRLGSTPPNAEISLDGKFITSDGSAKRHLVVGQQYVMACKPSEQLLERCPSCENKMTVRFRVPKRAPPGGIVSQKCDFRRCCPKSAFGLPK